MNNLRRPLAAMAVLTMLVSILVGCATAERVEPTATRLPASDTPVPPTSTPVPRPPTATLPPTAEPTPVPTLPTETLAPVSTRTPLPPPISPEFPVGTFYHEHSGGVFCVWRFNADGTHAYWWFTPELDVGDRAPYFTGTYSIEGNLYTETSLASSHTLAACEGIPTYAWTFDGKILEFQVVDDKCPDRQRTYEAALKWIKAE